MGLDVSGIGAIAQTAEAAIDRIWPDKTQVEKDKFAQFIAELNAHTALVQSQLQINLAAEQQKGWFTKGRDGALWTCVLGFFWMFFMRPIAEFVFVAFGHPLKLPPLDISTTQDLLGGLLGIGGMHMYQQTRK